MHRYLQIQTTIFIDVQKYAGSGLFEAASFTTTKMADPQSMSDWAFFGFIHALVIYQMSQKTTGVCIGLAPPQSEATPRTTVCAVGMHGCMQFLLVHNTSSYWLWTRRS